MKRFARQRREAGVGLAEAPDGPDAGPPADLAGLIEALLPVARAALESFARALADADDPALIGRAGRMAANYADAVRRSGHGRRVSV